MGPPGFRPQVGLLHPAAAAQGLPHQPDIGVQVHRLVRRMGQVGIFLALEGGDVGAERIGKAGIHPLHQLGRGNAGQRRGLGAVKAFQRRQHRLHEEAVHMLETGGGLGDHPVAKGRKPVGQPAELGRKARRFRGKVEHGRGKAAALPAVHRRAQVVHRPRQIGTHRLHRGQATGDRGGFVHRVIDQNHDVARRIDRHRRRKHGAADHPRLFAIGGDQHRHMRRDPGRFGHQAQPGHRRRPAPRGAIAAEQIADAAGPEPGHRRQIDQRQRMRQPRPQRAMGQPGHPQQGHQHQQQDRHPRQPAPQGGQPALCRPRPALRRLGRGGAVDRMRRGQHQPCPEV